MTTIAASTVRSAPLTSPWRTVARHPLMTFFALCFAITWGLGLIIIAQAHGLLPFALPLVPLFYLGTYAPTIAAVIVGDMTGGPAGRRAVLAGWSRWRVGIAWYLIALLLFPMVAIVAGMLYAARTGAGGGQFPTLAVVAISLLVNTTLGPIGEEAGWRGFALPRLQDRHGPLGASLLLGTIWGCWHGILWFVPGTGQSDYPFLAFVLGTITQQVILTWLYNAAGGSLPVMCCLHTSVNTTLAINGLVGAVPAVPFLLLTVALLTAVSHALVVVTRGRLGLAQARQGGVGAVPAASTRS
jgi:membrane protease YdiL (CAAX protease family)